MMRRWTLLLLLIAGIGLIGAGALALRGAGGASSALQLPDRLGGEAALDVTRGSTALRAIEAMHGKGFDLTDGIVAHYGDATVWVARTADDQGAAAMTATMRDRIAEGNSPFTPTGTRQSASGLVYELTGMGQAHFYWQAGDKVVWLATDPARAEQDLAELVQFIK